jgi:transposase
MSKLLLLDDLWAVMKPLIPPEPPKPKGGRPRISDRAALTGILVVLRSGTPWELLPRERACGIGSSASCKAFDHRRCRQALTRRRIRPRIARRGIESSAKLRRHRWVVERTLAWFGQFGRLAVRYERRADIHLAFTTLASALITWRFVQR